MVRCPTCGYMVRWSVIPIQPCGHCGMFNIMPTEQEARERGMFDGVIQPYIWEVSQSEVVLILDALETLKDVFQQALIAGNMNDEIRGGLTGSFLFARMTRDRLRKLAPDLMLPEEADVVD